LYEFFNGGENGTSCQDKMQSSLCAMR